jgi:hypothetical protein
LAAQNSAATYHLEIVNRRLSDIEKPLTELSDRMSTVEHTLEQDLVAIREKLSELDTRTEPGALVISLASHTVRRLIILGEVLGAILGIIAVASSIFG